MCEHKFKPLKIEKDGKKVHACQECGALKIGKDTIVVDKDYIDLASLTSDPALAEGRVWFRGDTDETRWSPDGTNVEIWSTAGVGAPDLTSIKGFTYLATGVPTDSWYFTADPNTDVWIRQYPTAGVFDAKYNFYGSYAHWTADNTFVDVPNMADNVYGDGEVLNVAQTPDGTKLGGYPFDAVYEQHGITWDGQYFWAVGHEYNDVYQLDTSFNRTGIQWSITETGDPVDICWDGNYLWVADGRSRAYQYKTDGTQVSVLDMGFANWEGIEFDGQYFYATLGALHGPGWVYKIDPEAGTIVNSNNGLGGGDLNGIAYDGNYLWIADDDCDYIYTIKASDLTDAGLGFDTVGSWPWGTAWDGQYLWVQNRGDTVTGPDFVYRVGASGSFDLDYNIAPA